MRGQTLLGSILCPEGNAHRELSEHTENYVRTKEIMGALVGLWEHASIYWRNDIDFNKVEGIKQLSTSLIPRAEVLVYLIRLTTGRAVTQHQTPLNLYR